MNKRALWWVFGLVPVVNAFAGTVEVTRERFPDADAVVVDSLERVAYAADGSYVKTGDDWIKVLTEKGRREESKLELSYNRRYGTASVTGVWIIGTNGVERAVDVSATTKDSTDNASAAANIYDPLDRKITCAVPGLQVGETIHYRTRKENLRARVQNQYADMMLFELTAPIVRARVEITAPAGRPLAKWALRNPLGNVTHEERTLSDGSILYSWTATNSPQAFPEPDMPPFYTQAQLLRVSTAEDWPTLSRWYFNLCTPHLAKTTPAMTNKVASLGRDLDRIYAFVAQEVRYMGLTMEDTSPGYAPHDVCLTFDNRYGVCRDKAALLVAMLRIAGFEAYPVLIHAGAKMDGEVPLPYFNHAIVGVRARGDARANGEGYILMDPTDESSRDLLPAYLSDCSYLVASPEGETLHTSGVPSAEKNALRAVDTATLEKDGSLLIESTLDFTGINDNTYRSALLRRKPDDRRKLFERLLRSVAPGAELLGFELSPADLQDTSAPLKAKLIARFPEMVLRGETRDELVVPMVSRAFGAANWLLEGNTSLEKRRYPLDLSSTAGVAEKLTLKLEGSLGAPLSLPAAMAIEGPYAFHRSFTVKEGVLTAERRLAVNAVEFSPAQYASLREEMKRVEAAERERPVFAKDALANANLRILREEQTGAVRDACNWCLTNTVVKEVLTYEGKKSAAELKFAYNPLWKKVELVSASVSNRSGRVAHVDAHEMNTFDCAWASAAPRYPASRELVVTLPSVEIGSVISYTLVTTVTDSPKPFYHTWFLDSVEPCDRFVLDVSQPGKEALAFDGPRPRVPSEPLQPEGVLFRHAKTLALGDFKTAAERLLPATEVAAMDPVASGVEGLGAARRAGMPRVHAIRALRDWMARHIRLAGPGLYEVPLARQLTAPAVVLKERYATRLDYVRTLAALLKGAGLEADVVFAADDADEEERLSRRDLVEYPDVGKFSAALCRVRVREGGFLGWGARRATYFLGTENEYTPLGASPYARCHYLDPRSGAIDVVPETAEYAPRTERTLEIALRENGAADVDVTETVWGPGVGGFRKGYAEMLPEDRSRHFQELLGELAQAASATRELETDTTGYPARRTFSAFIPNYATVANGAMTLAVPAIGFQPFNLTGNVRETPVGLAGEAARRVTVRITFPEGYARAEHLPGDYAFVAPTAAAPWYGFTTRTSVLDEGTPRARLRVELVRETSPRGEAMLARDYAALLKEWSRTAASRAFRTVTARKGP